MALRAATRASALARIQTDLVQGYGDDSAEIQKSNGGVPTVNLVVPVRFTHSHNGIVNRRDFDQTVELVAPAVKAVAHGATSWRRATGERQGSVTLARPGLRLRRRGDRERSPLTAATQSVSAAARSATMTAAAPKTIGWKFCQLCGR